MRLQRSFLTFGSAVIGLLGCLLHMKHGLSGQLLSSVHGACRRRAHCMNFVPNCYGEIGRQLTKEGPTRSGPCVRYCKRKNGGGGGGCLEQPFRYEYNRPEWWQCLDVAGDQRCRIHAIACGQADGYVGPQRMLASWGAYFAFDDGHPTEASDQCIAKCTSWQSEEGSSFLAWEP